MTENTKIRLKSIPVALVLLLGGFGFFQLAQWSSNDLATGIFYVAFGALFIISSIALILSISKITYIFTIIVCAAYLIIFIIEAIQIFRADKTGQGLVGLLFLAPNALICFAAIIFSAYGFKRNINKS